MIMKTCQLPSSVGPIVSPVSLEVTQAFLSSTWMMNFALNIPCAVILSILKVAVGIHMFKNRLKTERTSMKHVNKRLLSGALSMRRPKRFLKLVC